MNGINFFNAISLAIFIFLILFLSLRGKSTYIEKLYIICLEAGVVIYSGISTILIGIAEYYLLQFLIFNFLLLISFRFGLLFFWKQKKLKIYRVQYSIHPSIMILATIVFFLYPLYLIVIRRPNLDEFLLLRLQIDDIFARRESLKDSSIDKILYYLNLLAFPFFFILCNYLYEKKKILSIMLVFLWFYLDTLSLGYVSRYQIVVFIFFIGLIAYKEKMEKNNNTFLFHYFAGVTLVFVCLMPLLLAYQYIRMGVNAEVYGIFDSFIELFTTETTYGRYYSKAIGMHEPIFFVEFFEWIFTLPIPSFIKNNIFNSNFAVNSIFTQEITGLSYGDFGYSIKLPSILGESFIIYGKYFFWVHGIFFGLFLSLICFMLQKRKDLSILNIYFASLLLSAGRGGVAYFVGVVINSLFSIVVFLILQRYLKKVI